MDPHPFHTEGADERRQMILDACDYIDVQRRVEAELDAMYLARFPNFPVDAIQ